MNYKELKKLIKEEHSEEFNNLLPESAKIERLHELSSEKDIVEWQMHNDEAEDIVRRKLAEKYGYEIDDEFTEDENDF